MQPMAPERTYSVSMDAGSSAPSVSFWCLLTWFRSEVIQTVLTQIWSHGLNSAVQELETFKCTPRDHLSFRIHLKGIQFLYSETWTKSQRMETTKRFSSKVYSWQITYCCRCTHGYLRSSWLVGAPTSSLILPLFFDRVNQPLEVIISLHWPQSSWQLVYTRYLMLYGKPSELNLLVQ